ncbi:MAG: MMPL family transporter, partial [Candidatus Omnitrophica bacterium]|nr:MMPL family transporter [Candidatus Omnitrophota bacterium]
MIKKLIQTAIEKPKWIMGLTVLAVLIAGFQFPRIKVDTDPENMLPADAPVRVFHKEVKKEFALYDFVVLGIVNDKHPQGVFNIDTLTKIYRLTEDIKKIDGVMGYEMMAPSTKDNIEQDGIGAVRFNWLMEAPPNTEEEALHIRQEAQDHPMFNGTIVSEDGRMLSLYIPIEKKSLSYEVAQDIRALLKNYQGDEEYHITGLPVAEDQFGVEMFKQMAVSAPLAGLIIFLLMWWFFKSALLITAPMIVALVTVITTMGLLIGFGFPVHIMSSMIPIFLMPIAVLDSVHILSEFFDYYPKFKSRRKTLNFVIDELFQPMLFTSLTSAVGFFSLSFSPIPPVQVFGVYVAIGVMMAWVLTMLFIPAYIMLIKEEKLKHFGRQPSDEGKKHFIDHVLNGLKTLSVKHFPSVLIFTVIVVGVSLYGISRIQVNDNPVRWFTAKHPIRVADKILNKHFAGTYEAYLVMESLDE